MADKKLTIKLGFGVEISTDNEEHYQELVKLKNFIDNAELHEHAEYHPKKDTLCRHASEENTFAFHPYYLIVAHKKNDE